jgi:hypothetical protein
MTKYKYVTPEDVIEYKNFCSHHARNFARSLPDELWHYTDANGLIGIIECGRLWTTQVSCLNDRLEQRYFGDLVHGAIKERRKLNFNARVEPLLSVADEMLDKRDFSADGQFVACLSEVHDDLGQWRGYSGGGADMQ